MTRHARTGFHRCGTSPPQLSSGPLGGLIESTMIDQQKIIGEWMETIIQNGSWQEDNDLHVDEINPSFSSPDTWITGGIQSIAVAIRFRDNKKLPFVVALGFSLRSSTNPIIIVPHTLEEFRGQFDDSPPSLYLFKKDWTSWLETKARSIEIAMPGIEIPNVKAIYHEYFHAQDVEWRYSIFVYSEP